MMPVTVGEEWLGKRHGLDLDIGSKEFVHHGRHEARQERAGQQATNDDPGHGAVEANILQCQRQQAPNGGGGSQEYRYEAGFASALDRLVQRDPLGAQLVGEVHQENRVLDLNPEQRNQTDTGGEGHTVPRGEEREKAPHEADRHDRQHDERRFEAAKLDHEHGEDAKERHDGGDADAAEGFGT